MGGLLDLVQRGGAWTGCGPAQSPPRCTKRNSPSVNGQCLAGRGRPGSRSAASMMLDIPRTTTALGDRVFAVAGPRVWNSLPPAIRDPSLLPSIFGKLLKTYLFV